MNDLPVDMTGNEIAAPRGGLQEKDPHVDAGEAVGLQNFRRQLQAAKAQRSSENAEQGQVIR